MAASLLVPTFREQLESSRAGRKTGVLIPEPPGEGLTPGDHVVFAEATFDPMEIPTFIPGGNSIAVRLVKAENTGASTGR